MKTQQHQLNYLLASAVGCAAKSNSPFLKTFKRVICSIEEGKKNSCWLVDNYSIKSNTYPRFRDENTKLMVVIQRKVWEACHGVCIPDDQVVTRVCGNSRCTNPDHLELRNKVKTVQLMTQRRREASFLRGLEALRKYLREEAEMRIFQPNELIDPAKEA